MWGRTSSPLTGFRRTIGSDTGSGEATGRTTYRGRSARSRSQSPCVQVAPTVRSSAIAMLHSTDDELAEGSVSARPASVPKLDYRRKILVDDNSPLENLNEGDEGDDGELNIIAGSPSLRHRNGATTASPKPVLPVGFKQNGASKSGARDDEFDAHSRVVSHVVSEISGSSSSLSSASEFDKTAPLSERDLAGGGAENRGESKENSRNTLSAKAQQKESVSCLVIPPFDSSKGAKGQGQGQSPVQVQGNAAVAARALREVASHKDAKQQSLDYISS